MSELPNNLDRHIYERLLWQRILVLGDEIKDENANALCAQLILLNAEDPKADISLYINSPGGSVSAGLAIYDTMSFISNDVSTLRENVASSPRPSASAARDSAARRRRSGRTSR